jgi:hypothetical protein
VGCVAANELNFPGLPSQPPGPRVFASAEPRSARNPRGSNSPRRRSARATVGAAAAGRLLGHVRPTAKVVSTAYVDDLDGSEASGPVDFRLDGKDYTIDLSDSNAARLRDAFAAFVASARRASGTGRLRLTTRSGRPRSYITADPKPRSMARTTIGSSSSASTRADSSGSYSASPEARPPARCLRRTGRDRSAQPGPHAAGLAGEPTASGQYSGVETAGPLWSLARATAGLDLGADQSMCGSPSKGARND